MKRWSSSRSIATVILILSSVEHATAVHTKAVQQDHDQSQEIGALTNDGRSSASRTSVGASSRKTSFIRPSRSSKLTGMSPSDSSLSSEALSDRWNALVGESDKDANRLVTSYEYYGDSNQERRGQHEYVNMYSALERQLLGIEEPHPNEQSAFTFIYNGSPHGANNVFLQIQTQLAEKASAITYSVVLSTITILAMTAVSSFSSVVYGFPYSSLEWKNLPLLFVSSSSTSKTFLSQVKSFIQKRVLPKAWDTLQRMILMEMWRNVWARTFKFMRKLHLNVFRSKYQETFWETYAPGWLRRGVRAFFVKKVQGQLEFVVGTWVSKGYDLIGLMNMDGEDNSMNAASSESDVEDEADAIDLVDSDVDDDGDSGDSVTDIEDFDDDIDDVLVELD